MTQTRRLSLFLALTLLAGCFGALDIPEKFKGPAYQSSGKNTKFDFKPSQDSTGSSFPEYIKHNVEKIRSIRIATGRPASDKIVAGNAPFEMRATATQGAAKEFKKAVILIHGAFGSPYEMRDIAEEYARMGFLVRAPLLPGHGTIPGDLLNASYKEWNKAVDYAINDTLEIAEEVHLAGYSVGAGMAVVKAYQFPVKSIALFSPMLEINSNIEQFAGIVSDLGTLVSKARWTTYGSPDNNFKYSTHAVEASAQSYKLQKDILKRINTPLKIPVFVATSREDFTVVAETTLNFFRDLPNAKSRMVLYKKQQKLEKKKTANKDKDPRITYVRPADGSKILSLSHVSMVSAPSNPVYGINGITKYCNQYKKDSDRMQKCLTNPSHSLYFSAYTVMDVKHDSKIYRRISYNPFYSGMVSALVKFLNSVG